MEDIAEACGECQELRARPYRFSFLPLERVVLIFSGKWSVMLDSRPVLHLICPHIHKENLAGISSTPLRDILSTFLDCWSTLYVGSSNQTRIKWEASVTQDLFRDFAEKNKMSLHLISVELHKSIGV